MIGRSRFMVGEWAMQALRINLGREEHGCKTIKYQNPKRCDTHCATSFHHCSFNCTQLLIQIVPLNKPCGLNSNTKIIIINPTPNLYSVPMQYLCHSPRAAGQVVATSWEIPTINAPAIAP